MSSPAAAAPMKMARIGTVLWRQFFCSQLKSEKDSVIMKSGFLPLARRFGCAEEKAAMDGIRDRTDFRASCRAISDSLKGYGGYGKDILQHSCLVHRACCQRRFSLPELFLGMANVSCRSVMTFRIRRSPRRLPGKYPNPRRHRYCGFMKRMGIFSA